MFKAILRTQWKWSRMFALLAVVVSFGLPQLAVNISTRAQNARAFIGDMQSWSLAYTLLAGAVGLVLALIAWAPDHRMRHVYALALPVARWRYVLMRFWAGALFLLAPVVALWLGALIAARGSAIPEGLHGYPTALGLRFGFAAMVAYAIFFAISSATARTAGIILGALGSVVVAQFIVGIAGLDADIVGHLVDIVFTASGLLAVFGGRWMLIDV